MGLSCAHCKTDLPDAANFCFHCGKPIRQQAASARVFAIASHRGGVGKTTTAINLGAYLANAGRRTLVIDLDPLSEATRGLGVESRRVVQSIYEVLVGQARIPDVMKAEVRPNLSLVPAKVDLHAADIELVYLDQREHRLKQAFDAVRSSFDFVLIDCPTGLGLLTVNALAAADGVIMPLRCEYFALEGMQQLLNTIRLVRDRGLNPSIALFGVVMTMFDPRMRLGNEIIAEVREHFQREAFDTVIPHNVRLAEASSFGHTILEQDPRSPGALAYEKLAEEVIARVAVPAGGPHS